MEQNGSKCKPKQHQQGTERDENKGTIEKVVGGAEPASSIQCVTGVSRQLTLVQLSKHNYIASWMPAKEAIEQSYICLMNAESKIYVAQRNTFKGCNYSLA